MREPLAPGGEPRSGHHLLAGSRTEVEEGECWSPEDWNLLRSLRLPGSKSSVLLLARGGNGLRTDERLQAWAALQPAPSSPLVPQLYSPAAG